MHPSTIIEILINQPQSLSRCSTLPLVYTTPYPLQQESLSQIINFLKFREERLANVTEYNMEQDALDQKLAKAEDVRDIYYEVYK